MIGGYYEKGFCYRSDKYKLIFIHVSKNATTSIKSVREFGFIQDNILRYNKEELKDYTVFTVIRNPKKRFISAYLEICSRASMDSLHIAKHPFYWVNDQEKRFKKFLDEMELGIFDVHLLPQYYFLTDHRNNSFDFNYILNLENLGDEFIQMQKDLGITPVFELPRKNTSSEKHKPVFYLLLMKIKCLLSHKQAKLGKVALPIGYRVLDIVYRLMIRRKVPSYKMIESLIHSNSNIRSRVDSILFQDKIFYEKIRNK